MLLWPSLINNIFLPQFCGTLKIFALLFSLATIILRLLHNPLKFISELSGGIFSSNKDFAKIKAFVIFVL